MFRAPSVLHSINGIVYLTLFGILQHPEWEVIDVGWISIGVLDFILIFPV